jgi:DNA polymerase-3 subunit alpha
MVVFPKTLAKSGNVLQDDATVKVTAKVDNRRDATQLVVDAVEAVEPSASPPPPPAALASEMDLEDLGEMAAAELALATAPAAPAGGQQGAPHQPAPVSPVSTIRAKQQVKVGGNGNGNGHGGNGHSGNGKGNGMSGAASSGGYPEPQPEPGRKLRLELPRTGDDEADVRRMQEVYALLRESSGPDQVTLRLPNGVGVVVFQSQHTVSVSPALLDGLRQVLGTERVVAE